MPERAAAGHQADRGGGPRRLRFRPPAGAASWRGMWCTPGRCAGILPAWPPARKNHRFPAADANLSLRAPKVAVVAGRTPSSRFDAVSTTPSPARKRSFSPCGPLPRHSASQLRGALATKIGDFSGLAGLPPTAGWKPALPGSPRSQPELRTQSGIGPCLKGAGPPWVPRQVRVPAVRPANDSPPRPRRRLRQGGWSRSGTRSPPRDAR